PRRSARPAGPNWDSGHGSPLTQREGPSVPGISHRPPVDRRSNPATPPTTERNRQRSEPYSPPRAAVLVLALRLRPRLPRTIAPRQPPGRLVDPLAVVNQGSRFSAGACHLDKPDSEPKNIVYI